MRLNEIESTTPELGDIVEIELGDTVVETVVVEIVDGGIVCETDSQPGNKLMESSFERIDEAEYQGRPVKLGKPMQGDVKKFKVYVRNPKTGKTVKVNFGDPNMRIKKSNPKRRKSFRARHNCANPGPRTKARYWSCRKW